MRRHQVSTKIRINFDIIKLRINVSAGSNIRCLNYQLRLKTETSGQHVRCTIQTEV